MHPLLAKYLSDEEWNDCAPQIQSFLTGLSDQFINISNSLLKVSAERDYIYSEFQQLLKSTTVDDSASFLFQLATLARKKARTPKLVVFICDTPCSRQAKLAYGLKEIGWKVVLLYQNAPTFDPAKFYTTSLRYKSNIEALVLACNFSPKVYHCFSSWSFATTEILLKFRPGKIIFDDYDICAGSLVDELESTKQAELAAERYCIESSDGTINRSLNGQYSKKHMGYSFPKKQLFYPEYCWDRVENYRSSNIPKLTDAIHVVYVGTISPPKQFFNEPGEFATICDRPFIRALSDKGIHYHLYPFYGPEPEEYIKEQWSDVVAEAEVNPFFHLHNPVDSDDLPNELAPYHFGLCSLSEHIVKNGQDKYYKIRNFQNGTCNKAFDYIDAGLVHVSYGWDLLERLIGKDGPVIKVSREKTAEVLSSFDPSKFEEEFSEKIESAKRRLSVWRQAPRLAKFYESVAAA